VRNTKCTQIVELNNIYRTDLFEEAGVDGKLKWMFDKYHSRCQTENYFFNSLNEHQLSYDEMLWEWLLHIINL